MSELALLVPAVVLILATVNFNRDGSMPVSLLCGFTLYLITGGLLSNGANPLGSPTLLFIGVLLAVVFSVTLNGAREKESGNVLLSREAFAGMSIREAVHAESSRAARHGRRGLTLHFLPTTGPVPPYGETGPCSAFVLFRLHPVPRRNPRHPSPHAASCSEVRSAGKDQRLPPPAVLARRVAYRASGSSTPSSRRRSRRAKRRAPGSRTPG